MGRLKREKGKAVPVLYFLKRFSLPSSRPKNRLFKRKNVAVVPIGFIGLNVTCWPFRLENSDFAILNSDVPRPENFCA